MRNDKRNCTRVTCCSFFLFLDEKSGKNRKVLVLELRRIFSKKLGPTNWLKICLMPFSTPTFEQFRPFSGQLSGPISTIFRPIIRANFDHFRANYLAQFWPFSGQNCFVHFFFVDFWKTEPIMNFAKKIWNSKVICYTKLKAFNNFKFVPKFQIDSKFLNLLKNSKWVKTKFHH